MSCTGGSRTKSSSPERSAALRVAPLATGRYSTVSRLPSNMPSLVPHQSGLRLCVVFTPGSRETRMKGPVPLELSAEKVSSRLVMSCGFMDLFFPHHALLMMKMFETIAGSTGFGAVVTNSTV